MHTIKEYKTYKVVKKEPQYVINEQRMIESKIICESTIKLAETIAQQKLELV